MYPNISYFFKDWFGWNADKLSFINSFGLMVAIAFGVAAWLLNRELARKEREGLLTFSNETVTIGKPANFFELVSNFFVGFLFGFKIIGVMFNKPEGMEAQEYIFSSQGNILAGIGVGALLAGLRWYEKNKTKLAVPEQRVLRIWPKDRVGDIVVIALFGGIFGAKLFDAFENWSSFIEDPIKRIVSPEGLTFFGGLIVAAVLIIFYARSKKINVKHLCDACAPGLMLAYAIGRIGCQLSGDGDWGVYNSAYYSPEPGVVALAKDKNQFETEKLKFATFLVHDKYGRLNPVSAEILADSVKLKNELATVPSAYFKAPSFLPKWLVAATYPRNVNQVGIPVEKYKNFERNNALPLPVFPTPIYETTMGVILFLILWGLRKKIKIPLLLFGIYLVFVGIERFLIEKIRVNTTYDLNFIKLTQAEIISVVLAILGIIIIIYSRKNYSKNDEKLPF